MSHLVSSTETRVGLPIPGQELDTRLKSSFRPDVASVSHPFVPTCLSAGGKQFEVAPLWWTTLDILHQPAIKVAAGVTPVVTDTLIVNAGRVRATNLNISNPTIQLGSSSSTPVLALNNATLGDTNSIWVQTTTFDPSEAISESRRNGWR